VVVGAASVRTAGERDQSTLSRAAVGNRPLAADGATRGRVAVAGGVPRPPPLLAALPSSFPRALDVRTVVDRAGARTRVPGCLRDPLLRQPWDARLRPLPLAHRHRRQPPLCRRDRGAARPTAAPRRRRALHPTLGGLRRAAD